MRIYAFDDVLDEVKENKIDNITLDDMKTNGVSMRFGDRVVKFSVSDETVLDDDGYKDELKKEFEQEKNKLTEYNEQYKNELKIAYDTAAKKLTDKTKEYNELIKQKRILPVLSFEKASQGLSVSFDNNDKNTIWYLNCIYAPKYVNDNVIDPAFAKRLVTPIRLKLNVGTDNKVFDIVILKMFGNRKFQHYHSLSTSSDCWGDFKFSGIKVETENDAFGLFMRALSVLDTINEFSIGTRNPKGLSRFDTIKKHLLGKKEKTEGDVKMNQRNTRTGIDNNIISERNDNVWTTT